MPDSKRWWRRLAVISAITLGTIYILFAAGVAILPSTKSSRVDWDEAKARETATAVETPTEPTDKGQPPTTGHVLPGSKSFTVITGSDPRLMSSSKSLIVFPPEQNTGETTGTITSSKITVMPGSKSKPIFENTQNVLRADGPVDWPNTVLVPATQSATQPTTQPLP
ncbi:MAG: hypothetical protein H7144_18435 [Burkholderiales bacterium]|nr:hypothetical protein [Phycisphaerae bacterium]